ncbi:MAG: thiamine phosphate synthase, partial [Erysipelotrichaceae bacterium]
MKLNKKDLLLYAITDRTWTTNNNLYEQVKQSLIGGATILQLREKDIDEQTFYEEALQIKKLCHKYSIPFIINDDVLLTIKCHADGVHVGQSDMNANDVRSIIGQDKILGVSVQNVE